MSTVEAHQCRLHGGNFDGKTILLPFEAPPLFIPDEYLVREEPRLFDKANEAGTVHEYDYRVHARWYWKRREDPTHVRANGSTTVAKAARKP